MKVTDLMIGDCVYYDMKALVNNEPVVYREAHQISKLDIAIFTDDSELVKPIPLTEEILKANGFIRNELCSGNYYFAPVPDMCDVMYHISEDSYEETWHVEVFTDHNDNNYSLFNVCYAHELQHALRLCGLNDLANNFKIE